MSHYGGIGTLSHQYNDTLSPWFEMYLGLEQANSGIRTYEPQFVPGLLQTEDCARHPGPARLWLSG